MLHTRCCRSPGAWIQLVHTSSLTPAGAFHINNVSSPKSKLPQRQSVFSSLTKANFVSKISTTNKTHLCPAWKEAKQNHRTAWNGKYWNTPRWSDSAYNKNSEPIFYGYPDGRQQMTPTQKVWLTGIGTIALIALGTLILWEERTGYADALPDDVKMKLHETYGYLLAGLALTAATATFMFQSGVAHRMLMMGIWKLLIISLIGTLGALVATLAIPKEAVVPKHLAWVAFNAAIAASLCPLGFMGGRLILNAAMATGATVGAVSLVAATAPSESFLWMGGPLAVGLGVIIAASFGRLWFPTSAILENVVVYGGAGLFGALTLYDTQKVISDARRIPKHQFDPINESISLYLDVVNLFTRVVQILGSQKQRQGRR